jgi:hypothetical protein
MLVIDFVVMVVMFALIFYFGGGVCAFGPQGSWQHAVETHNVHDIEQALTTFTLGKNAFCLSDVRWAVKGFTDQFSLCLPLARLEGIHFLSLRLCII